MTDRTSRTPGPAARSKAPASAPDPATAAVPMPGRQALRRTLGDDGYQHFCRQRRERGTALGELADALWNTAREADRLHAWLRRHATLARHRLNDILDPRLDPAFVPVTGVLRNAANTTDLHAARFAQQMNQLTLLLQSYQTAARRAGG